jgi:hypothetical protein
MNKTHWIFPIDVTHQDIRLGTRDNNQNCPVGLAWRRCLAKAITAEEEAARQERRNSHAISCPQMAFCGGATIPPPILQFIRDFDAGRPVKPITGIISIEIPASVHEKLFQR